MKDNYDNQYAVDNVYGHAVALLARHRQGAPSPDAVHLDLGCGFGRMAEVVRQTLGCHYLGLDKDVEGVASLRQRGLEAGEIDFAHDAATLRRVIDAQLAGRRLVSITLLDVLEHLADPSAVLQTVQALAQQHGALFVVSVPNVAHRDVGFKLAFGRYDVTQAGLLDHTHRNAFTEEGLRDLLAQHGLHPFDRHDVRRARSDQAFPATHPALADGTVLTQLLRSLRDGVDDNASVYQYVAACLPGPVQAPAFRVREAERAQPAPFLSIVTRTQGRRPGTLRDVLLCLAAQTCDDFELIVIGHKLDVDTQLLVERILEDSPDALRSRVRLVRVDHGNRTTPLNVGFAQARGQYVTILDDDDLVLGHWVETFRDLARQHPGAMLRSVAVRQEADETRVGGEETPAQARAVSVFQSVFPSRYDILEHLRDNKTPGLAMAIPRAVFSELGLRFDETLSTAEDWDFMMRAAFVCGVQSSESVTCIYRWWQGGNSRAEHSADEWSVNRLRILEKMDRLPVLLPAGSLGRLREILDHVDWQHGQLHHGQIHPETPTRAEARRLVRSISWRVTEPLRRLGNATGRGEGVTLDAVNRATEAELLDIIRQIKTSGSWRRTRLLRAWRARQG